MIPTQIFRIMGNISVISTLLPAVFGISESSQTQVDELFFGVC